MDVKSTFLNTVLEEFYNEQPEGFMYPSQRNLICKLHKASYGSKQPSKAWYERLHGYLLKIGFKNTNDNRNLYIKEGPNGKILLEKIFVDDIIFGGHKILCKSFGEEMRNEF